MDSDAWRDVTEQITRARTETVAEIRVLGDRMERRQHELEGRVTQVEVDLAAHVASPMHDGTRDEFHRMSAAIEKLTDQLAAVVKKMAYGAGAVGAAMTLFQLWQALR